MEESRSLRSLRSLLAAGWGFTPLSLWGDLVMVVGVVSEGLDMFGFKVVS